MCNALVWPQQCWKSSAHGWNSCCTTFRRSRNKKNVASRWLKNLTGFKLSTTSLNNTQQHATRGELLANFRQNSGHERRSQVNWGMALHLFNLLLQKVRRYGLTSKSLFIHKLFILMWMTYINKGHVTCYGQNILKQKRQQFMLTVL